MQARENKESSESVRIDYDKTRDLYLYALMPGGLLLFSGIMNLESGLAGRDGKTGHSYHDSVPKRIYDSTVGSIQTLLGVGAFAAGAIVATPIATVTTIPYDVANHHYRKKYGHGFFSQSNHNPSSPQKSENNTFSITKS